MLDNGGGVRRGMINQEMKKKRRKKDERCNRGRVVFGATYHIVFKNNNANDSNKYNHCCFQNHDVNRRDRTGQTRRSKQKLVCVCNDRGEIQRGMTGFALFFFRRASVA